MDGMEWLREWGQTLGIQRLSRADLEMVGVVVMYAFVAIGSWRLWRTRNCPRRRRQLARGLAFMDGVVAVLRVVVLLAVGVLIAVARAAGRSGYDRW